MPIVWHDVGTLQPEPVTDLWQPLCLAREQTEATRALAKRVVQESINGVQDWAPVRQKTPTEKLMAKYNQVVVAPSKTVAVFRYNAEGPPGSDPIFVRNFDDLAQFEAWYKGPPVHRDLGCSSNQDGTTVLLDITGNPNLVPKGPIVQKLATRAPRQEGGQGGKWYIVNSHVGMVLRAAGFLRASNAPEDPLTFKRGEDVCVIVPPALDKKSSSVWKLTLAGKATIEGMGGKLEDLLKGKK